MVAKFRHLVLGLVVVVLASCGRAQGPQEDISDMEPAYIAYAQSEGDSFAAGTGALVAFNKQGQVVHARDFEGLAGSYMVPAGENYAISSEAGISIIDKNLNLIEEIQVDHVGAVYPEQNQVAGRFSLLSLAQPDTTSNYDGMAYFRFDGEKIDRFDVDRAGSRAHLCDDGSIMVAELYEDADIEYTLDEASLLIINPDGSEERYPFSPMEIDAPVRRLSFDCELRRAQLSYLYYPEIKETVDRTRADDVVYLEPPIKQLDYDIDRDPVTIYWFEPRDGRMQIVQMRDHFSMDVAENSHMSTYETFGHFQSYLTSEWYMRVSDLATKDYYDVAPIHCDPRGGTNREHLVVYGQFAEDRTLYLCWNEPEDEDGNTVDGSEWVLLDVPLVYEDGVIQPTVPTRVKLQELIRNKVDGLTTDLFNRRDLLTIRTIVKVG